MSEQFGSRQFRLPLSNIQNKPINHDECTNINKTAKTQSIYYNNIDHSIEDNINKKEDFIIPDIAKNIANNNKLSELDEYEGNSHYIIQVQNALKEAIEENDKVYIT